MANCPKCGTENKDSAKFCIKCGETLTVAAVTQEVPVQASTPTPQYIPQPAATAASGASSSIHVTSKFVRWGENVLNIPYVERLSTSIPSVPFPKMSILLLVLGIILIAVLPMLFIVGILALIAAIIWIVLWAVKKVNAPKGVSFFLNSGSRVDIFLDDHNVVNGICSAVQSAMNGESVDFQANVSNVKTSTIAQAFSLFNR